LKIEIAQRRWVVEIKGEVLTVLEAAAGENDRHVPCVVTTGVAKVADEENHRLIEQARSRLAGNLEFHEELAQDIDLCFLDGRELAELLRDWKLPGRVCRISLRVSRN